jgi:steroid 5-alpha reductase family enzyme
MTSIAWVVVYIILQMLLAWGVAKRLNNPSVIDFFWPVTLTVAGLIYLLTAGLSLRLMIVSILLLIWGLRLASVLFMTRILRNIVDKRYVALSAHWVISRWWGFFWNFQLQGLFVLVMTMVFWFAARVPQASLTVLDWVAIVLCVVGIVGETIADRQLENYKKNSQGAGVCEIGLWNYSRHPNYFFDWLTWCGFAVFGLSAPLGCLGWLSPALLYWIMTRVTGPMTEEGSIQSRGEVYLQYQRTTSMFFPWIKKSLT